MRHVGIVILASFGLSLIAPAAWAAEAGEATIAFLAARTSVDDLGAEGTAAWQLAQKFGAKTLILPRSEWPVRRRPGQRREAGPVPSHLAPRGGRRGRTRPLGRRLAGGLAGLRRTGAGAVPLRGSTRHGAPSRLGEYQTAIGTTGQRSLCGRPDSAGGTSPLRGLNEIGRRHRRECWREPTCPQRADQ